MTQSDRVYHLALRETHAAAGASMARLGDWMLPEHYGDAAGEHAALRQRAAILDRSFRSRILVTGTDAPDVLSATFEGHVGELEEGRSRRVAWLGSEGHIGDLALISRTGGIAYMVAGEPGRRAATLERLRAAIGQDFDVRIEDRTETTCLIGLAGPAAAEVAKEHLSEGLPARLQSLHAATFEFHGFRTLAVRTSDTGEDGFEFTVAPAVALHLIETLTAAGIPLAGFEAQESARVEACIPAFDPDLASGLSPAQADLDMLLGIEGGEASSLLSAIILDGAPVPAGTVVRSGGGAVGTMRSCLPSFTLGSTIGFAVVNDRVAFPGTPLDCDGQSGTIVAKPFYRRRSL